jgi:omega-6 fatty acid desaturase (delta-12 desaturase)
LAAPPELLIADLRSCPASSLSQVVLVRLIAHQVFGLPLYLIMNASGQKHFGHVDHYNPGSKIFKSRDFWDIVWSDIGIASVIGTMIYWANVRSWQEMVSMWMIPYMHVNAWLVLITFLQHTDPIVRESPFTLILLSSLKTIC